MFSAILQATDATALVVCESATAYSGFPSPWDRNTLSAMPPPNTPPLRLLERPPRRPVRAVRAASPSAPHPVSQWLPDGLRRVWQALRSAT